MALIFVGDIVVQIEPEFEKLLKKFDLDHLYHSENSIFGLWPDLTLAFFNDGWFRFSRQNLGEPQISRDWPLGRSLCDAIPAVLSDFFNEGFLRCQTTGHPWAHDYDCSSPEVFRLMHQTVYPLKQELGFLVVNSLLVEKPIEDSPGTLILDDYIDNNGIIHQCAKCRKVQNLQSESRWDMITFLIASPPPNISHGLCPVCLDYYYPNP